MEKDDTPTGRVLSRRELLALMGGAAAFVLGCVDDDATPLTPSASRQNGEAPPATAASGASTTVPSCVVVPEQTEGPFFVDERLNRSDIRSDPATGRLSAGTPLTLMLNLSRVEGGGACAPLPGAMVDVWHCDAMGVYSDTGSAAGQKFLRGFQTTDSAGRVQFLTIYPGWYQGRAVHIHFKVRIGNADFTSQLYFDEAVTREVYRQAPYAQRGQAQTANAQDSIFRNGGDQLLLKPEPVADGYRAVFDLGLRL